MEISTPSTMKFKTKAVLNARRLLTFLYQGPIKYVGKASGIERNLRKVLQHIRSIDVSDTCTVEIDGNEVIFVVRDQSDVISYKKQHQEIPVIRELLSRVNTKDIFYDIGANRGFYSCILADKVDEVVAFEPHPEFRKTLEQNVEKNEVSVRIIPVALSNTRTTGNIDHMTVTEEESNGHEVDVRMGDSLIANRDFPPADIIKIDIEGAELDALRGLETLLDSGQCRLVSCELHPEIVGETEIEELEEYLHGFGYTLQEVHRRDNQPYLIAELNS